MSWEPWSANHRAGVLRLLEGFRRRNIPVDARSASRPHIGTATPTARPASTCARNRSERRFLDAVVGMGYDLIITELDVPRQRDCRPPLPNATAPPRTLPCLSRPDAELRPIGRHHGVGNERSLFLAAGSVAPAGRFSPSGLVPMMRTSGPSRCARRSQRRCRTQPVAIIAREPASSTALFLLLALLLARAGLRLRRCSFESARKASRRGRTHRHVPTCRHNVRPGRRLPACCGRWPIFAPTCAASRAGGGIA